MKLKKAMLGILLVLLCTGCSQERGKVMQESKTQQPKTQQYEKMPEDRTEKEIASEAAQVETIEAEIIIESESKTEAVEEVESEVSAAEYMDALTLEEKVAQMFMVTPEVLVGGGTVTAAGEATQAAFNQVPVGGLVYMQQNLQSEWQVQDMLSNIQTISMDRIGLPILTSVDEEGGTVARVGGHGLFDVPYIGNMSEIGATGDAEEAYAVGKTMGRYLSDLGFDMDFAPVADVLSNSENEVVRYRSFGSDADLVSQMTVRELDGLKEEGIFGTLKHFPGHGATAGDTHAGYAYTNKTLEELNSCELLPFQAGIDAGVSFIMMGHISLPNVIGDDTPASLSRVMITQILREQMGYEGIVITDAFNMGAIVQTYSAAQAAVEAIQAGVDIILMPSDFTGAYYGVLDAVNNGSLTEERINQSLERILKVKLEIMQRKTDSQMSQESIGERVEELIQEPTEEPGKEIVIQ